MERMHVWKVYHSERNRPSYDEEGWTEWWSPSEPALYKYHETALRDIKKLVDAACNASEGRLIKRDSCYDGWEYFEWEENDDGIIKQHIVQIAAMSSDSFVIMD